ncbi:MAG: hypothetical protein P8015_20490, partial [Acidihalobacter sp.]
LKEKIAGSDFSRQPRRGKAQGCAEQIGSGASPIQSKSPCIESRPKLAPRSQQVRRFHLTKAKRHPPLTRPPKTNLSHWSMSSGEPENTPQRTKPNRHKLRSTEHSHIATNPTSPHTSVHA